MQASKETYQIARRLFRLSFANGKVSAEVFEKIVKKVVQEKPRNYRVILNLLKRNLRLHEKEFEVTVTTTEALSIQLKTHLEKTLAQKQRKILNYSYIVDESLLGGMRVQLGFDVWDGSIKTRIERFSN